MNTYADPTASPVERLTGAQRTAALEACLRRLPPEVRATVLLRFRTDDSYPDLAAKLGARADALQARVARALIALRRCMEGKGWSGE